MNMVARLDGLQPGDHRPRGRAGAPARAAAIAREGPRGARPRHAQAGRGPVALQLAALGGAPGAGAPAPRLPKNPPASARRNRAAVEEKERLRAEREEALEAERQELEKLEGQAATIGEEHAATRAELAGLEERHRGERTAMARLEQQFRETTSRRNAIAPEIERLGEQRARLLADNIELDQQAAALAGEISALGSARQRDGRRRMPPCAKPCAPAKKSSRRCALAVQESQEKRSQIEVDLVRKQAELKFLDETSRKELNCPVEELAAADDPVPDADAIAEAEQARQRSAQPHRRRSAR